MSELHVKISLSEELPYLVMCSKKAYIFQQNKTSMLTRNSLAKTVT